MQATKTCPHCHTALEFVTNLGERMVFTAHDDAFCAAGTRYRVHMLEAAMVSLQETYERRIARERACIDAALAKRGLPSLEELFRDSVERARVLHALAVVDELVDRSLLT